MPGLAGRCRLKRVETSDESACFQLLKLEYYKLLSNFAFDFNLRRYSLAATALVSAAASPVGWCRLTLSNPR